MDEYLDLRIQKTKQSLVDAIFDILSTSIPYSSIKVIDICKKAHKTNMTFYSHFSSKNDLINYGIKVQIEQWFPIPSKLKPVNLNQLWNYLIRFFSYFFKENKELIISDFYRINNNKKGFKYLNLLFEIIEYEIFKELKLVWTTEEKNSLKIISEMISGALFNCYLTRSIKNQTIDEHVIYNATKKIFVRFV